VRRHARWVASHIPGLLDWFRAWRSLRFAHRQPVMTPLGFIFAGTPAMERGEHEPYEVALVRRCLRVSDVFVNVGASYGYYSCLARHLGKEVIAFEPLPSSLHVLHRNLQANGWQDVEVHPVAVGEQTGTAELFGSGTAASLVRGWAGATGLFRRTVAVTTLDDALDGRLEGRRSLFLIDVEGGELACLRGARRQLALRPASMWIIEIVATEHQPRGTPLNRNMGATFDLLREAGFSAWTVEAKPRPVGTKDIEQITSGHAVGADCQNYLFLSQEASVELVTALTSAGA
jgi:FkbM family methyltransferase